MIRILIFSASFLLFTGEIAAGLDLEKPKIAVLDFKTVGESSELGEGAAEILRTVLMETGQYTVIERGMLKQILEEQKLGLSGIIDSKTAVGIGKILGVKLVAVGSVVKMGETYTLNVRFVDVETGEVVSGKKLTSNTKEEIPKLCSQIAKMLTKGEAPSHDFIKEEPPAVLPEPVEKKISAQELKTPLVEKWAVGIIYPGAAVRAIAGKNAGEVKFQTGSGIFIIGPRYYWYFKKNSPLLFWGLEADYISFKGDESKGSGFAVGGFAGGEILLSKQLIMSMDFGPIYISLSDDKYSESESGIDYVINFGIYLYFN